MGVLLGVWGPIGVLIGGLESHRGGRRVWDHIKGLLGSEVP